MEIPLLTAAWIPARHDLALITADSVLRAEVSRTGPTTWEHRVEFQLTTLRGEQALDGLGAPIKIRIATAEDTPVPPLGRLAEKACLQLGLVVLSGYVE